MPISSASSPSDPEPVSWRASAACADLPSPIVFGKGLKQARHALQACTHCRVRRECEEVVAPADSWFDGVCAGRLWRNGRAVAVAPDPELERG